MVSHPARVLVIGATGRTGRLLAVALVKRGHAVRALVADVGRAASILPDRVSLVAGRVEDQDAVCEAVGGADAVVFAAAGFGSVGETPKEVDYLGVERTVRSAGRAKLKHFVLLSSAGVTQPEHPHNMSFQNVLRWKLRGEEALRAAQLSYTVVRALGLRDRDGGHQGVRMVQGDRIAYGEDIARADVASFLADTICFGPACDDDTIASGFANGFDPRSLINATLEIYNDARVAGGCWDASRPALSPDKHPDPVNSQ